jgi:hypothetical protein
MKVVFKFNSNYFIADADAQAGVARNAAIDAAAAALVAANDLVVDDVTLPTPAGKVTTAQKNAAINEAQARVTANPESRRVAATVLKTVGDAVYFEMGTVTEIKYSTQRTVIPGYLLKNMNPTSLSKGNRMTQGNIVFRTLNVDSLKLILANLIKEVGNSKLSASDIASSPLLDFTDADAGNATGGNSFNVGDVVNYDQLPFFDIIVISMTDEQNSTGGKVTGIIEGVKITSQGMSESVDSTEMNNIVSFVSLGGFKGFDTI